MSCEITMTNVETVVMNCGSEVGFLKNPDNNNRINKSKIITYTKDDSSAPTEYKIAFTLEDGVFIEWSFTTEMARDAALANVDEEMNTQTV